MIRGKETDDDASNTRLTFTTLGGWGVQIEQHKLPLGS
jgi:hypothetical protein